MRSSSLIVWLLGTLGVLGCDDDEQGEARLPLPPLVLPSLSCRPSVEPAGECARDADCGSQRCVLTSQGEDREVVALSCAAPIGTAPERARCEAGEECESGLCALGGVCTAPCASASDCQEGQVCASLEVHVPDGLAPVMGCTRSAAFQADVTFQKPRVEQLTADAVQSVSTGSGEGSSLLYLKTDCAAQPLLLGLTSRESGDELYSLEKLINGQASPNPLPATGEGALLTLLVPNNPRVEPSTEGYELELVVEADTPADLVVASRARRGKVLDLNVFYVGGGASYVRGGFHPGDNLVHEMFERLRERYDAIGLALGQIRELEVTGALRDELSVIELEEVLDDEGNLINVRLSGLEELFGLSAGVDDSGINVFLVSDMGPVLGVSGGIPGALGVHGTVASGVALALDVIDLSAENVLMHELSHHMGLFHTSELNGAVIEPLSDTPACHPERDANGDSQLDPSECQGAGADNLMFWAGVGYGVSAQQREILQRSLILR